jgi:hypothetical protein
MKSVGLTAVNFALNALAHKALRAREGYLGRMAMHGAGAALHGDKPAALTAVNFGLNALRNRALRGREGYSRNEIYPRPAGMGEFGAQGGVA